VELEISEATVKTHINSLLGKLASLTAPSSHGAIQRGIVPLESLRNRSSEAHLSFQRIQPMKRCVCLFLSVIFVPAHWQRPSCVKPPTSSWPLSAARAPVEKEHIETEMRTPPASWTSMALLAGVILITAGYSAEGKYCTF